MKYSSPALKSSTKSLTEYHKTASWFETNHNDDTLNTLKIAYFSMEYGLTECMPLYSGGLGILAGDHLKSTSYSRSAFCCSRTALSARLFPSDAHGRWLADG